MSFFWLAFLNRVAQVQSSSLVSLIALIRKRICMYYETDLSGFASIQRHRCQVSFRALYSHSLLDADFQTSVMVPQNLVSESQQCLSFDLIWWWSVLSPSLWLVLLLWVTSVRSCLMNRLLTHPLQYIRSRFTDLSFRSSSLQNVRFSRNPLDLAVMLNVTFWSV